MHAIQCFKQIRNALQVLSMLIHSKCDELSIQGGLFSLLQASSDTLASVSHSSRGLLIEPLMTGIAVLEHAAPKIAARLSKDIIWDAILELGSTNLVAAGEKLSYAWEMLNVAVQLDSLPLLLLQQENWGH
jgi:hypothetical protein